MRPYLYLSCLLLAACGPKSEGQGDGSSGTSSASTDVAPTSGETGSSTLVQVTGEESTGGEACPDPNSTKRDGECFCDEGFEWCSPDDPNDLSCCALATTTGEVPTTGGTTAPEETTAGPDECAVPPPRSCDPEADPFYCDHDERCGPGGGSFYVCEGGVYVVSPEAGQDSCKADGFDFAYGCVMTASLIEFTCGIGPGTPCEGDMTACADPQTLNFCLHDKLGAVDCVSKCQEEGDGNGVTFDTGFCGVQRGETVCVCCDEGDRDCPL